MNKLYKDVINGLKHKAINIPVSYINIRQEDVLIESYFC